jgi:uncharacterized alpha-E superfamily protein
MLLSRVANALYWMSRYIERAENIARFIDVNTQLTLDRSSGGGTQWMPLVSITRDEEQFRERYGEATRANVMRYLTLDREYPNSVVSCIAAARENARTVRDAITSDMWKQINQLHLMVQRVADAGFVGDRPNDFYGQLKNGTLLFAGITNATMSRTIAWDFCRLGRMVERADKTSRILDVKYFLLLPRPEDVGTALDAVQWTALLRSVGGLEMYRRHHGAITPAHVAGFLMLNDEFPRSLLHCLLRGETSLNRIVGSEPRGANRTLIRSLGRLRAELEFGDVHEILAVGLHDYLDNFQERLNTVDNAMITAMFDPAGAAPPDVADTAQNTSVRHEDIGGSPAPEATQTQTQTQTQNQTQNQTQTQNQAVTTGKEVGP